MGARQTPTGHCAVMRPANQLAVAPMLPEIVARFLGTKE
jgi:hypothetical protein